VCELADSSEEVFAGLLEIEGYAFEGMNVTHLQLPWSVTKLNGSTFVQSQIRRIDLDSVSSFRIS
jgi:hypothetical protein